MFTPNKKMIQIDHTVSCQQALDSAVLCWSPALDTEVWMDGDNLMDDYEVEPTTSKPKPYSGSEALSQEWAILRNKNGNKNHVFWAAAENFEIEIGDASELVFISNDGLDIDPTSVECSYNDKITFSNDENSWEVGDITSLEDGKVTLYSAIESVDSIETDEDGDDVYASLPQDKFENIRQLFIHAGFKVKVSRYRRD